MNAPMNALKAKPAIAAAANQCGQEMGATPFPPNSTPARGRERSTATRAG